MTKSLPVNPSALLNSVLSASQQHFNLIPGASTVSAPKLSGLDVLNPSTLTKSLPLADSASLGKLGLPDVSGLTKALPLAENLPISKLGGLSDLSGVASVAKLLGGLPTGAGLLDNGLLGAMSGGTLQATGSVHNAGVSAQAGAMDHAGMVSISSQAGTLPLAAPLGVLSSLKTLSL